MRFLAIIVMAGMYLAAAGCGGGGSDTPEPVAGTPDPTEPSDDDSNSTFPPDADTANYSLTVENYWGPDDFPQDYPEAAHLSLFGGATHNQAVSFWNPGELASPGVVKMAEDGLVDILLQDEVAPAIEQGTADSQISHLTWTPPPNGAVPGTQIFPVQVSKTHPLVTLVSMLGPSPDWFVGVSGLSLRGADDWLPELEVDLPLYDGGSRSNITPVMHGPLEIPQKPIALVAYEETSGTYQPTDTEQIVAKFKFVRVNGQ